MARISGKSNTMSADNRICIMEWNNEWHVWHGCLSSWYDIPPSSAKIFDNENDAHKYAVSLEEDRPILEGGISNIDVEEQKNALISKLRFDLERLYRLNKVGTQNYFTKDGEYISCEIEPNSNFKKLFELMENLDKIVIYGNS